MATKELLERAVMGDEAAIEELAALLDGATVAARPMNAEYLEHITQVSQQHPRIFNNPQRLAALTRIDTRLTNEFPELGWERRTALAINAEQRGQSDVEIDYDAQNALTIEEMALQRKPEYMAAQQAMQRQGMHQQSAVDESRIRRPPADQYDDESAPMPRYGRYVEARPRNR